MDADDQRVATLYARFLRERGPGHRALDWSAPESQTTRFRRLAAVGVGTGDRVLDVGCGLGDLLPWLVDHGLEVDYWGIDITPEMIAHCRATHARGRFLEGNILEDLAGLPEGGFDWVLASGVFAHRKRAPWDYMRALITAMTRLARRGVAFNSQSTRAPNPGSWSLFHADPEKTLDFCQSLGWSALLTHDAGKTDFTVTMWPPEAKS